MLYTALIIHDGPVFPTSLRAALAELGCEVEVVSSIDDDVRADLIAVAMSDPVPTIERLAVRHRLAGILAIVPRDKVPSAFAAGATDCAPRSATHDELVARARSVLRIAGERTRRSKRERKLGEDIRRLQAEKHALERSACVDSLTGVANRRHALALLDAEWKRSLRDGTPLSLVMVDLDCFHAFNERYGHVGGDDCLRRTCAAMVGSLRRPSDFLGRYGGEEFVAVLANTDGVGARLVAERLRAAVETLQIAHVGSTCAPVATISVGFATCHPSPESVVADLLSKADHALLTAKALGRNRVIGEAPQVTPRVVSPLPWTRFPVVVADPWFADRIPAFLDARRDDASSVLAAAQIGAFDRVRTVARRIRAAAIEHGFERIQRLATVVDQAARDEDLLLIAGAIDELMQYVDHVQVTYRRPLDQSA